MTRVFVFLLGVLALALLVLAGVWLAGEVFRGLGAFFIGLASVLLGLLKFLALAGLLCGLTYFVTSSWRRPSR
jgi:hypothetical protein